ncbi:MAG: AI-2E family transporter [Candidatus Dormibacter sp.]|uniref:AI-2E family transporter n=1 Tax=Candidatus Dormibacter sp. TaxID=2973982 RepID=UPI000DB8CA1F|nr:MAG: AI-2E family transporter [Candidatus Dormibacteraeota bacterium]
MIPSPAPARLQRALMVPLIVLAWLAIAVIVVWLISHVTKALLILVLAAVIAFAVTPLVKLLSRYMKRVFAIAISYLIGFTVVFGLLTFIALSAANEISNFVSHLGDYTRALQDLLPTYERLLQPFGVSHAQVLAAERQAVASLQGLAANAAKDVFGVVQTVLGTVVDGVLVLILSIYLTASGPRFTQWMHDQLPGTQQKRTNQMRHIVNTVVGGYVRGTLTLSVLIGVLVFIGMELIGVRYALLLGILAFFMEFVPILGVMVSGAVCVLVGLFGGGAGPDLIRAGLVLIWFIVVHIIEGDVVGPRIMGKAVGIHPAVAILALVAGSELFGLWGALFGAPIAGLLQATVMAAFKEYKTANAPPQVVARELESVEPEPLPASSS